MRGAIPTCFPPRCSPRHIGFADSVPHASGLQSDNASTVCTNTKSPGASSFEVLLQPVELLLADSFGTFPLVVTFLSACIDVDFLISRSNPVAV